MDLLMVLEDLELILLQRILLLLKQLELHILVQKVLLMIRLINLERNMVYLVRVLKTKLIS
nr:MAG TPA: hypothetical protein [Bacteriophage sp.]